MKLLIIIFTILVGISFGSQALAMEEDLKDVWNQRPDLQEAFDSNGDAIPGSGAGFLIDMADWARQYGWRSYSELGAYIPEVNPPIHWGGHAPQINAAAWVVVDKNSGAILGANHAEVEWPIASITKLMTANVVSSRVKSLEAWHNVYDSDNVGGARIWAEHGANYRLRDLMYATLVGSANNAANSIARSLGGTKELFVDAMNETASELGLRATSFSDPSGIEVENVSTAREVARMSREIFSSNETVRSMTQTYRKLIEDTQGNQKSITTTNWMLYRPEYDDVWIMAGKTGFLHESKWNVVEQLRSSRFDQDRELIVVVLGSETRAESFKNVKSLSDWAWASHSWK
jgi:D-alanyl-D-alanine carboxypeptidase